MAQNRIPVIVGPTASGKTAAAVAWARRHGGHVVSADSRQVYRHMDIGTAKPTADETARAPHHLIDIRDPDENFSAGDFAVEARTVVTDLDGKGVPLSLAGGSGFYINALIRGTVNGQPSDPAVRESLRVRLETEGRKELYAELRRLDPVSADRIHGNDEYRILRALEICTITGQPVRPAAEPEDGGCWKLIGIGWDRTVLYRRIDERVDRMLASGLVGEVEALMARGYHAGCKAMKSVGYQEVFAFIDGNLSREEMTELIKTHTRQYAKRQLTWFGRQQVSWLDGAGKTGVQLADLIDRELA